MEYLTPNFNVGIDCEEISRWRTMLSKLEVGSQRKLFTEAEHKYCRSFKDPAPHYAARWCAKEALIKALSPFCQLDVRTIEVTNDEEGRPSFILHDPEAVCLEMTIRLSLTHSKETAMAVVVVAVCEGNNHESSE